MVKRRLLVCCLLLSAAWAWAQPPVPLLWKVSGASNSTSVYLLGSFHVLKASDYPLAPSVDAALADAQQLYFEVAPQELGDPALPARMVQAALRTDGKTLQQTISPKTWAALQVYAARHAVNLVELQGFKPWFVAMAIMLGETQKMGVESALGLDQYLMERAAKAGKPSHGLESASAQFAVLDGLDAALQEAFLLDTLQEAQDFQAGFDALHSAWRQGDAAALERTAVAEMSGQSPALYQRVNVDRNRAWLPRLEAQLTQSAPGNTLVVVGAMHLVGSDGIVRMLQAKGYRVERLR